MRQWRVPMLVAAIVAVALTVAAVAFARTADERGSRPGRGPVCDQVMSDPQALAAMRQLRADHRQDMQEWWRRYGTDPSSDAARKALRALQREHLEEMRDLLEKSGIELPDEFAGGGGYGRGACGGVDGGCGAASGAGGCGVGDAGGQQGSGYGGMMGGGSY